MVQPVRARRREREREREKEEKGRKARQREGGCVPARRSTGGRQKILGRPSLDEEGRYYVDLVVLLVVVVVVVVVVAVDVDVVQL